MYFEGRNDILTNYTEVSFRVKPLMLKTTFVNVVSNNRKSLTSGLWPRSTLFSRVRTNPRTHALLRIEISRSCCAAKKAGCSWCGFLKTFHSKVGKKNQNILPLNNIQRSHHSYLYLPLRKINCTGQQRSHYFCPNTEYVNSNCIQN